MLTTKYIRHPVKGFVLWDALSDISHQQMAALLRWPADTLHSAGFVQYDGAAPRCTGLSASLGIGCNPGDTRALLAQLGVPTVVAQPHTAPAAVGFAVGGLAT